MRLKVIDYNAMKKAFDEKFKETRQLILDGETHLDNLAEGFLEADRVILALPEIDAEPVRYGKWVKLGQRTYGGGRNYTHYCSECGKHGFDDYERCHGCGARMDGESE